MKIIASDENKNYKQIYKNFIISDLGPKGQFVYVRVSGIFHECISIRELVTTVTPIDS